MIAFDASKLTVTVSLDDKLQTAIDTLNTQVKALLVELIQTRSLLAIATDNAPTWAPTDELAKRNYERVNDPRFDGLWKMRKAAIDIMTEFGQMDGAHHKAWVIDQAMRALLGDEYNDFIWAYEKDAEHVWDKGIIP